MMASACAILLTFVIGSYYVEIAAGHSFLAVPRSRNAVQRDMKKEFCPHCLIAGGPDTVKSRSNNVWPTRLAPQSHGLCGDPVQGRPVPASLTEEPYLQPGKIVGTYVAGQEVEFQIAVSTHHKGHYEFRICDEGLDGTKLRSAAEGQKCLDKWVLKRVRPECNSTDRSPDCQPLDEEHPERWYVPPPGTGHHVTGDMVVKEMHTMKYRIPDKLECSKCTLQWYLVTGNSCLYDEGYFTYFAKMKKLGWPAEEWSHMAMADYANCGNTCCGKVGIFGEEYWNCADIRVRRQTGSGPQRRRRRRRRQHVE